MNYSPENAINISALKLHCVKLQTKKKLHLQSTENFCRLSASRIGLKKEIKTTFTCVPKY